MKIEQANECMWYGKPVLYEGKEYRLTAVIKRRHRKKPEWYYQAELMDNSGHSLVIANLEKIQTKGGEYDGGIIQGRNHGNLAENDTG